MAEIADTSGVNNIGMLGIGAYRPERVVTNEEICQHIDSSDEWIRQRTGIVTRHRASAEVGVKDLALTAGREAVERSGIAIDELDAIGGARGGGRGCL